jgi:hypothetical protein
MAAVMVRAFFVFVNTSLLHTKWTSLLCYSHPYCQITDRSTKLLCFFETYFQDNGRNDTHGVTNTLAITIHNLCGSCID